MIKVTLEGKEKTPLYLNPHQIECIEEGKAHSILVMLSSKRYRVSEDVKTIVNKIILYRRRIGIFKNEE